MKKKIILLLVAILAVFVVYLVLNKKAEAPGNKDNNSSNGQTNMRAKDLAKYTIDVQQSIYYVVNKKRPLPKSYIPANLLRPNVALIPGDNPEEQQLRSEAATAAQSMFEAATEAGFNLVMASGYRSAALQETVYNGYVARDGQEAADRYSARPGTSEHQTGLSLDITTSSRKCYLEICFTDTPEGKWLRQNAPKYGFHLRYQRGKEKVTGYQFEPWHFRYVGNDLAQRLFDSNQTMEEFFGI
jgi:D-alanyl-D-alanine carboxypeptidase